MPLRGTNLTDKIDFFQYKLNLSEKYLIVKFLREEKNANLKIRRKIESDGHLKIDIPTALRECEVEIIMVIEEKRKRGKEEKRNTEIL